MIISSLLCKNRRFRDSIWGNYRTLPPAIKNNGFVAYASEIMQALLAGLLPFLPPKMIDCLFIGIPQLIDIITNYKPFVYDLKEYQYTSSVNNANAPFLTEMLMLMTPMADYLQCRHFIRFIADAIFWIAEHHKGAFLNIRDKNGRKKSYGSLDKKDSVEFVSESGSLISTCTWQKIFESYELILSHIEKDKTIKIMAGGETNREVLSCTIQ